MKISFNEKDFQLQNDIRLYGAEPICQEIITAPFKQYVESGAHKITMNNVKMCAIKIVEGLYPKWYPKGKYEIDIITRRPNEEVTVVRAFYRKIEDSE